MKTDKEGFTHVDPKKAAYNQFVTDDEEGCPIEEQFERLWEEASHTGYEEGYDEGVEAESERLRQRIEKLENERNECIRDMKAAIGILGNA